MKKKSTKHKRKIRHTVSAYETKKSNLSKQVEIRLKDIKIQPGDVQVDGHHEDIDYCAFWFNEQIGKVWQNMFVRKADVPRAKFIANDLLEVYVKDIINEPLRDSLIYLLKMVVEEL